MAPVHKLSAMGSLITNKIDYPSMLAGNPAFVDTSYESIATVVANGSSSSITFSSIPQTYQHLQIRGIAKSPNGGPALVIQYNGDSSVNYKSHYLEGNGASAYSGVGGTNTYGYVGYPTPGSANSNMRSTTIIDILDYTNTNKNKTTKSLTGYDTNNTVDGYVDLFSNLWMSTAAITSITLTIQNELFVVNSQFALYGIKG
jgi:hypothetical protein